MNSNLFSGKLTLTILFLLVAAFSAVAQKRSIYTNPVAAGDYPDPSVIRVGADYYATAMTGETNLPPSLIQHEKIWNKPKRFTM